MSLTSHLPSLPVLHRSIGRWWAWSTLYGFPPRDLSSNPRVILEDRAHKVCLTSSLLLRFAGITFLKDISCARSFNLVPCSVPHVSTTRFHNHHLNSAIPTHPVHSVMPVSHLGLSVSHIPSATSFYLAALQPLGYHYIGQQRDAIGLGVTDADFFLCQEQSGYVHHQLYSTAAQLSASSSRPSPTHIAFAADNAQAVRHCYIAALNAGGSGSGKPGKRSGDCHCFNAAVTDLDGNTIEFIYREPAASQAQVAPPAPSRVESWQQDVARSSVNDDLRSLSSRAERAKSRVQTALDVASSASKSMKGSTAPAPGITRSRTEPVTSRPDNGGKTIVGTLLGAAAGAAFAYAMVSSERENARDEEAFASSSRSKPPSMKDARSRSNYEGSTISKKSSRSSKQPERSMRAIEAPRYDNDEIQDVLSRYTSSRRPLPQRSNTYDASEYAPRSSTSHRSDRFNTKCSTTLPIDMQQQYLIEGPRTAPASRHTSRRGSFDDNKLKRHDSGVSMHSHRSRRSFDGGRRSSISRTSTIKQPKGSLYESAAGVPLPSSKAQSYISAADMQKASSIAPSYITAAEMPLPSSRTASYVSAAQVSLPPSRTTVEYSDAEESDGLGDMKTVVPDDSISCVDFSGKSKKSKSKSGSTSGSRTSRHGSKRSEAPSERTIRPANPTSSRHSAQTLPVRAKADYYSSQGGKRSTHTYV